GTGGIQQGHGVSPLFQRPAHLLGHPALETIVDVYDFHPPTPFSAGLSPLRGDARSPSRILDPRVANLVQQGLVTDAQPLGGAPLVPPGLPEGREDRLPLRGDRRTLGDLL